jgi:hypothetical protein
MTLHREIQEQRDAWVRRIETQISKIPKGYQAWSHGKTAEYKAAVASAKTVCKSNRPTISKLQSTFQDVARFYEELERA